MAVLLRYIWWSDQRLGAVSSTKPHFLFPLSQYFTNFPLFGPIKFDCCELPTFIFPSPPFSSIIQVPGIVSPYQDGSGWIGRLTGFLLAPWKGTLFNPSGALWTLFILEFRPAEFLRAHLAPITPLCHHFPPLPAIVFAAERFCPNYLSLPLFHQLYHLLSQTPFNTLITFQPQSIPQLGAQ